jgi:hypothetical protein
MGQAPGGGQKTIGFLVDGPSLRGMEKDCRGFVCRENDCHIYRIKMKILTGGRK